MSVRDLSHFLPLRFGDEHGSSLSLRKLSGHPFVLVSVEHWQASAPEELALRAQLRGLGSELFVLWSGGATRLGPDDPPSRLSSHQPLTFNGLELWVVDAGLQARWTHHGELQNGSAASTVLAALRDAVARMRQPSSEVSRRDLLITSLVAAFALTFVEACATTRPSATAHDAAQGPMSIDLTVNGARHAMQLEPRVTLLDALRENLGLTGTKKGCDLGQCGACTVLSDGVRIDSCLTLAVQHQGKKITTIEGLSGPNGLHPMQAAFLEADGLQCGYCTPGQILSAIGMLSEGPVGNDAEIREGMSGNLCRCGAYPNIVAAVREVAANAQQRS